MEEHSLNELKWMLNRIIVAESVGITQKQPIEGAFVLSRLTDAIIPYLEKTLKQDLWPNRYTN
jgi:hypothetical protein